MRKLFFAVVLLSLSACAFAQQNYVGRYDVFTGFSFLNSPKLDLEQRGFNTQIGFNARRWLAFGFDYSIQNGHASLISSDLKPALSALVDGQLALAQAGGLLPASYPLYVPFDATTQTFTAGPQLVLHTNKKMAFFAHPSIGAIHERISLKPHDAFTGALVTGLVGAGVLTTTKPADTTYFYGGGGGVDYHLTKHFNVRADVEFVHVFLYSDLLRNSRNSLRVSIGPSFNFGKNVTR